MSSNWTQWLRIIIICPPLLLAGCGSGGDSGVMTSSGTFSASPATLSGVASKGPFAGASLAFHAVTGQGTRGVLMASTRTDEDGRFSTPISMAATGPVWVECRVDRHRDEASQQMMSLPQSRLVTFCVPEVRPTGMTTAPLTPFNHMAFRLAMAAGGVSTARMREAMASLSTAVGADVATELPADLSTAERVRVAFGAGQMPRGRVLQGMYLAAMSRRAQEMGVDPIDYMLSLGRDFEDGRLDGVDGRGQTMPGFSNRELDAIRLAADAFSSERAGQMQNDPAGHTRMVEVVETMRLGQQAIVDVPRLAAMGDRTGMPGADSMPDGMPTTMPGMDSMPGGMPMTMPGMDSMPGGMPMTMPGMDSMPGGMPTTMPGMDSMPGGMPMTMPGMDSMPGGMPMTMPDDMGSMPDSAMTTHMGHGGSMGPNGGTTSMPPAPQPAPDPAPPQPAPDPHVH